MRETQARGKSGGKTKGAAMRMPERRQQMSLEDMPRNGAIVGLWFVQWDCVLAIEGRREDGDGDEGNENTGNRREQAPPEADQPQAGIGNSMITLLMPHAFRLTPLVNGLKSRKSAPGIA
jgi:hypothetical protein